jgi:hypothetical protein
MTLFVVPFITYTLPWKPAPTFVTYSLLLGGGAWAIHAGERLTKIKEVTVYVESLITELYLSHNWLPTYFY